MHMWFWKEKQILVFHDMSSTPENREEATKSSFTLSIRRTILKGHVLYTRVFTHDIQIMWLVEKSKMVQVYFTLDPKGIGDQRNTNGWKGPLEFSWPRLLVHV